MNWEQKLKALQAIADTSLRMRQPGDWYVSAYGREVERDGMLCGEYGNGETPEKAIEDDWRKIAESGAVIALSGRDKRVLWNGFMWEDAL